jgi:hypothetical protein
MKKLTFKQAEKLHKELWGWLAKTGDSDKEAWPGWVSYNKVYENNNNCFACALVNRSGRNCHDMCPVNWTKCYDYGDDCLQDDSPFIKWDIANTEKTRKKYAAIIRDLPWRKKP